MYSKNNYNRIKNYMPNNISKPNFEKIFEDARRGDYRKFVKAAEEFAEKVKREGGREKNKSNQLRNLYNEVIKVNEDNCKKRLPFLKVRIAYSLGKGKISIGFYEVMNELIEITLKSKEYVPLFKEFMEAFIGYHKFYESKKR